MIRYHHDSRQTPTGREIRLLTDGQGKSIPLTHRVWLKICQRCQSIPWCRCGVQPAQAPNPYASVDKEIRATWERGATTSPAPKPLLRLRRFDREEDEGVPPVPTFEQVLNLQRQQGRR